MKDLDDSILFNEDTFIIAEIGTSHGGSIKKARDLILAATDSGADCAKFQVVLAHEIVHPQTGMVNLPGGEIPLYQRFKELEQPFEFYSELQRITMEAGIKFLASPFGIESARILRRLNTGLIKIASPEVNHFPLLREVKSYNWQVILSSGVSKLGDIESALEILGDDTILLHCITSYPAPEEEYNLRVIPNMAGLLGCPVGLSDHSMDPILVPGLAVAVGARVIEKHFTLSRTSSGLDDPIALPPKDFTKMTKVIRALEKDSQEGALDYLETFFSRDQMQKVLGSGIKKLAPSELENYNTTNRSIMATCEILAGERLNQKNISLLRSEKQLSPGLHPTHLNQVLGAKAKNKIPSGKGILWKDLIDFQT